MTPAPWPIERRYEAPHTYCPQIRVGPATLHFVQGYHTAEEDAARKARAEADARAIAEVPAMVEALRDMLPDLEILYSQRTGEWESMRLRIERARAILARIDGGAA